MDIDELISKYGNLGGGDNSPTPPKASSANDVQSLFDKYSSDNITPSTVTSSPSYLEQTGSGLKQGFNDVINSVASGIGYVDKTVAKGLKAIGINDKGEQRAADFQKRVEQENQSFEQNYGGLPVAEGSRLAGQAITTAPLVPVRAVQAINVGMKAVPVITAAGTKVAAPLINKLGAAVVTGGLGGSEFGALTSSANDKSLAQNVGEGLITGALAGPVVAVAGAGANKLAQATKDAWTNLRIDQIVDKTGMPASAVKNIIGRLQDAGYTPQTAQAELNRLGPGATLADLDASLTTEASGLAAMGEKPTAILKGRFGDRADTAVDETRNIVNSKLGQKPDIEVERQAIVDQARQDTSADYKAAHASNQVLDVQPVIDNIDKQLETAVGSKQTKLNEVKSYLFRTFKNADTGAEETIPRFSIKDLHESRIGIDELLGRLPSEGSSQKSATYRAINDIRGQVDDLLKENHEMKSADTKFADRMTVAQGLQQGYDALKQGMNKEQFAKMFDNSSPEVQDKIRKGMRAYIGDYMEGTQQGEATGAQRLFSKKSVNQANITKAFGSNAQEALDALEKQEAFRATEKAVRSGSQTAERLAVQKRYGEHPASGVVADALKGAVLDAVTGSPGVATVSNASKRLGANAFSNFKNNKLAALAEGSADILSRTGTQATNALKVMQRVNTVQDKLAQRKANIIQQPMLRLPVALSGAAGQNVNNSNK